MFAFVPMFSLQKAAFVVACALLIHVARVLLYKALFSPIANWAQVHDPKARRKLLENLWYGLYYPVQLGVGWWLLTRGGHKFWPFEYSEYWTGHPNYFDWDSDPSLHAFYLFELAFYLQGSVALFFFDNVRKDWLEMVLHHSVTCGLICLSYVSANHRIGLCVMMLHDASDVILYGSKAINYMAKHGKRLVSLFDAITTAGFVAFAVSFLVTRLFIFPVWVILPAVRMIEFFGPWYTDNDVSHMLGPPESRSYVWFWDVAREHTFEVTEDGFCFTSFCFSPHWLLVALMIVLLCLHVFWFTLILRMARRQLFGSGKVDSDIRSDGEDEEDDDKKRQ